MIRVLLADDHGVIRDGLGRLIGGLEDVELVGTAADGADAIDKAKQLQPDVVVMDLDMPRVDGIEATRKILAEQQTNVLVLTAFSDRARILGALEAGACGYLLKDASIQDLMQGIRAASVGESLISPHIAGKVLQHVRATTAAPEAAATIRTELSDREIQVLKLIANGKDNAMIAGELHISPKTVKNHISNILMKLQIENRIQAAVYAVRSGIV